MQYGCDTISTTFCDKYSNRIFIQIAVYDRNCQRDRTTRNDQISRQCNFRILIRTMSKKYPFIFLYQIEQRSLYISICFNILTKEIQPISIKALYNLKDR